VTQIYVDENDGGGISLVGAKGVGQGGLNLYQKRIRNPTARQYRLPF
jgi:hypothetical protein